MKGSCYAVWFSNDVVKVGRSGDVYRRISQYRQYSRSMGIGIKAIFITAVVEDSHKLERKIIKFMGEKCEWNTKEHFICGDFETIYQAFAKLGVVFIPAADIASEKRDGSLRISAVLLDEFVKDYISHPEKTKFAGEPVKFRVRRLVENSKVPLTRGVLRNKLRDIPDDEIDAALAELITEGDIVAKDVFNRFNKTQTQSYKLRG